jgi:O-methyltransferase
MFKTNLFGYKIEIASKNSFDEYAEFRDVYEFCKEYTMTGIERMYALYKAVEYIVNNNIVGDIVECGVWRGGSSMLIAQTLMKFNCMNKVIYMYDTFEGMSTPTEKDKDVSGSSAHDLLKTSKKENKNSIWCIADLDDVKNNMAKTNYPSSNIRYIKGKVEHTIPQNMPESTVALLRLDTDWYESTLHEMKHLYPLLISEGVLIIDDYGHWQGAKKAVDEYFTAQNKSLLLNRIDYTGRIAIKT